MSDPANDPTAASAASAPVASAPPPPHPAPPPPASIDPSRRRFLGMIAGAGTCALGAAFLAGPTVVTVAPGFQSRPDPGAGQWLSLGALDNFAVGAAPTRVILRADVRDAWMVRPHEPIGAVLVQRTAADKVNVFSAVCPHLGCAVDWAGDASAFVCPCHGAVFGADGATKPKLDGGSNPAPRPLDTLAWRVAGGNLEVQWMRYRSNVADKVAVG